jgi:hypothetical protein
MNVYLAYYDLGYYNIHTLVAIVSTLPVHLWPSLLLQLEGFATLAAQQAEAAAQYSTQYLGWNW